MIKRYTNLRLLYFHILRFNGRFPAEPRSAGSLSSSWKRILRISGTGFFHDVRQQTNNVKAVKEIFLLWLNTVEIFRVRVAFSALTLLVGRPEGHPATYVRQGDHRVGH